MPRMRGVSLIEVLVAVLFLGVLTASVSGIISQARRQSMDAYFEFSALQVALEPIEILRSFGYRFLESYESHPLPGYPLGWSDVRNGPTGVQRPVECESFSRQITKELVTDPSGTGPKAIRLTVTVVPQAMSRLAVFLSRKSVTVEALVVER